MFQKLELSLIKLEDQKVKLQLFLIQDLMHLEQLKNLMVLNCEYHFNLN